MERFNESPFPAALADRDEDGFPVLMIELPTCQSCGHETPELVACPWFDGLLVGACCKTPVEPECECRMDGGDLFDPRGCELHDSESNWNVQRRGVSSIERYEGVA